MEPNGQYLCIVPNRSAAMGDRGDLFLPFSLGQHDGIVASEDGPPPSGAMGDDDGVTTVAGAEEE